MVGSADTCGWGGSLGARVSFLEELTTSGLTDQNPAKQQFDTQIEIHFRSHAMGLRADAPGATERERNYITRRHSSYRTAFEIALPLV